MNNTIMVAIMFFALCGLIFFIIGIVLLKIRKKKEVNCTSTTFGKVRDIVRHKSYDSNGGYSSSWHPVFEYNIGELKFVKESHYGSSQPKYAIGQDVEVCYNPDNYNEFYIVGETVPKTLGVIFTIVGIIVIIIAIFFAILIL